MCAGGCKNALKPCSGCGCQNCPPGEKGENGTNGLSAYELWIQEGNVGTVQDFLDSLVGAAGAAGADGVDGVPNPKINFYAEYDGDVNVSDSLPDPTVYHHPPGYAVLSYTNSTGVTRDYIVHGSFDSTLQANTSEDVSNWVDGAIIKTVAAVDSVQWEHTSPIDINISLFDGPNPIDVINIDSSPDTVNTSPGGNPVEVRFASITLPKNVAFFKKVTLNDGETVSLKFKTKDASAASLLNKAQIFVLELD